MSKWIKIKGDLFNLDLVQLIYSDEDRRGSEAIYDIYFQFDHSERQRGTWQFRYATLEHRDNVLEHIEQRLGADYE